MPAETLSLIQSHAEELGVSPENYSLWGGSAGARMCSNVTSAGIPVECHVLEHTQHGFGVGTGTPVEGWMEQAVLFWKKHEVVLCGVVDLYDRAENPLGAIGGTQDEQTLYFLSHGKL